MHREQCDLRAHYNDFCILCFLCDWYEKLTCSQRTRSAHLIDLNLIKGVAMPSLNPPAEFDKNAKQITSKWESIKTSHTHLMHVRLRVESVFLLFSVFGVNIIEIGSARSGSDMANFSHIWHSNERRSLSIPSVWVFILFGSFSLEYLLFSINILHLPSAAAATNFSTFSLFR